MNKPTLRVNFCDFWATFVPNEFWIYRLLSKEFDLIVDAEDPQLLIFCDYGVDHLRYRCHKIYYSHENRRPNIALADHSFSFHGTIGPHHYFSNLIEEEFFESIRSHVSSPGVRAFQENPKTRFCNFVYSNPAARERITFCQLLMRYKRVDCPGKVLNNHPPFDSHGYTYEKKIAFISNYRFTIAFENESAFNYTTEKILHPLIAGSIPIYWGNPRVAELFNPEAFINCHDFDSFESVVKHVRLVNGSPERISQFRNAPPILPSSPLAVFTPEYLRCRLMDVVEESHLGRSISSHRLYPVRRGYHWFAYKLRNRMIYTGQYLSKLLNLGKH